MINQTEKIPTKALINYETGEIEDEYYEGDRLTLRRSEQDDYAATHVIDFNKGKSFVKIYDDVVPLLEKYLTLSEFKLAISLMIHVSYEDCIIRRTRDRRSEIINIKKLSEIHDMNYDYTKKLMMSLKKKGVVGKHETGTILSDCEQRINTIYTVNPFIYFRGSDLLTPVHSFYINSGWKELLEQSATNESDES